MIEKILERLEEVKTKRFVSGFTNNLYELGACHGMDIAKEVVKEVAKEYGNGWIPVETELPPMPKENPLFENKPLELYLVTVEGQIYPFRAFWNGKFFTDGWGKVKATAWMELPAPYQKGE